jgi:hypothetical protein
MAVLRSWPRPPKWPIQPGTVDPGQRWVWHTRPRLIIPIWEHVSALTNQRHRRLRYSSGAELWLQNTSMSMLRTRYGPALSLPTTDGHELEPPNNGNVSWSANDDRRCPASCLDSGGLSQKALVSLPSFATAPLSAALFAPPHSFIRTRVEEKSGQPVVT